MREVILDEEEHIYSLDWSSDGTYLAIGLENGGVDLWNTETDEKTLFLLGEQEISSDVTFSSNSRILAVDQDTVRFWDVTIGEELFDLPIVGVTAFSWSPDSSQVVVGTSDGKVQIWNVSENG